MARVFQQAPTNNDAVMWLHHNQCTDGLPVIVPTPELVDRFVAATGLDAGLSLGTMGPGGGAATVEAVAANAVMAGCDPDYMPIVIAAIEAILAPEFDLPEMQATTHSTAPLIIVNGPWGHDCGVASGFGALGPGFRANASIGRAVRLCMMNIGMARPGVSDMALLGHPGKFTYCLAEDEQGSPWDPWHVSLGYQPADSAVTVVGAEAPHSVMFVDDADNPRSHQYLLNTLAAVLANAGSNNMHLVGGVQTVVLNPDHAEVLARSGLDRQQVAEELHDRAVVTPETVAHVGSGFARAAVAGNGGAVPVLASPDDLVIIVAGGTGLYSVVMPSWAAGAHVNRFVHRPVGADLVCDLPPAPSMP